MRLTKKLCRAILLKALEVFGKKQADRGDLIDGRAHKLELTVSGTIDGVEVVEKIGGTLTVNAGTMQADNKKLGGDLLVALLLGQLATATRKKIVGKVLDQAEQLEKALAAKIEAAKADKKASNDVGTLHDEAAAAISAEQLAEAKRLFDRFTLSGTKPKNGSLAFTPST